MGNESRRLRGGGGEEGDVDVIDERAMMRPAGRGIWMDRGTMIDR